MVHDIEYDEEGAVGSGDLFFNNRVYKADLKFGINQFKVGINQISQGQFKQGLITIGAGSIVGGIGLMKVIILLPTDGEVIY